MAKGDQARRRANEIVSVRLDRLGRTVGFELLGRLMDATPVDTGRARGNWNASVGAEDPSVDDERRAPQATAEGQKRIEGFRLGRGERLFCTNGVPYIGALNNGSSRQAPAAFIQKTTDGMRGFVRRQAEIERRRGTVGLTPPERL